MSDDILPSANPVSAIPQENTDNSLATVRTASPFQADLDLAERIRAGEESAKGELASRFSSFFRKLSHRSDIPPDDCEDVIQQALLLSYRRIVGGRFRGESTLETWAYKIIKGQIIEYWRKRRRQTGREESLTSSPNNDSTTLGSVLSDDLLEFDAWLDVVKLLRELTEQERAVLLMHSAERRSVHDIGRLLQLSDYAVRKLRETAQERFRRLLGYRMPLKKRGRRKPDPIQPAIVAQGEDIKKGDTDGRTNKARAAALWRSGTSRAFELLCACTQHLTHSLLLWARQCTRYPASRSSLV